MPTEKNIPNLVINKVESQEVYDYMVANNLVNDDELYFVGAGADSTSGGSGGAWFGTCMTAASTAAKDVTTKTGDFKLEEGSVVYVQFNTAVTSTSTTLNVDSTGAIAIQTSATNALSVNQIAPKAVVGFVYDGTVYRMLDSTIATTTYYGMTKLSSSTSSTSTSTAATSSAVKAVYDLANAAKPTSKAITLVAASWSDNSQTITASGVTVNNNVVVSPAPDCISAYIDGSIRCTAQSENSLTFVCVTTPTVDIVVNLMIC